MLTGDQEIGIDVLLHVIQSLSFLSEFLYLVKFVCKNSIIVSSEYFIRLRLMTNGTPQIAVSRRDENVCRRNLNFDFYKEIKTRENKQEAN